MLRASLRRLCGSLELEAWSRRGVVGGLCRKQQGFATAPTFDRQATSPWLCKYATFFDPEIYFAARRSLAARKKARVSDAFARSSIAQVIQQMKSRSFQFQSAEESFLRSPFTDQLVQEAFRLILQPAFPHSSSSSAQAALQTVRRTWTGATWAITSQAGLLVDHSILGNLIMGRVEDQQLLDLYWKLVRAGHVRSSHRHNLTGVSKGGILWPLFTEIYHGKLDSYASSLHYVRYGDQWMVGVPGPKSLAVHIRDDIMNLTGDDSLTISHLGSQQVKFLGTLVSTRDKRYVESLPSRRAIGRVVLEAPINEIVSKLVDQGFAATPAFPRGRSGWIHLGADEILRRYLRITVGLRDYYAGVDNANMMRRVFWILRFSAVFTLCRKWRISARALFRKMANHPRWSEFLKGRVTSSR